MLFTSFMKLIGDRSCAVNSLVRSSNIINGECRVTIRYLSTTTKKKTRKKTAVTTRSTKDVDDISITIKKKTHKKTPAKLNNDVKKEVEALSIEKQYVKLSPRDHVLQRPGMYLGSLEPILCPRWVPYRNASNVDEVYQLTPTSMYDPKIPMEPVTRFITKNVLYRPALFKIFDEIVANAVDQSNRKIRNPVTAIDVNVNVAEGWISVYNNGCGIPIVKHKEHNVYIPELIFGNLLTSSNYNDDELRVVGGTNGLGAKCTAIFSKKFTIETTCGRKKYSQTFHDNLSRIDPPIISEQKGILKENQGMMESEWTRITFWPDLERFQLESFDDATLALFEKRVYDAAACTSNKVAVSFNGAVLPVMNFQSYMDLFVGPESITPRSFIDNKTRWEVGVCMNPCDSGFDQVSFVNGIPTSLGGTHIDHIVQPMVKEICELYTRRLKRAIKPAYVRENLMVFVKCQIENPSFTSQSKDMLSSSPSSFGSAFSPSVAFMKSVTNDLGLQERVSEIAQSKDKKALSKTDGRKSNIISVPKLDDAEFAGTSKSHLCTLILTEGDSAKTFAISGLSVIGRKHFGVFPLRGKFINVKDISDSKVEGNSELVNLKKALGLQHNYSYATAKERDRLRYGRIMICTDSDVDGHHIKGLVMNLFHTFWPDLLKQKSGFIQGFITPIIKVKRKHGSDTISFFDVASFKRWMSDHNKEVKSVKYYKGLGTSTAAEAREYFTEIDQSRVNYIWDTDNCSNNAFDLAFRKKSQGGEDHYTSLRKKWIMDSPDISINYNDRKALLSTGITFSDFINKELIQYAKSDCMRSIPSLCDGLKTSQRKIIFACLKKRLFFGTEIKVEQLTGYVSEKTAYQHGEASLSQTIISLAQNFAGASNVNLLEPIGQFGTRILRGKDHASARYIFTSLSKSTPLLFDERDDPLYNFIEDDFRKVEPLHYLPVLPVLLINGSEGIATGFSCSVPQFNPSDVAMNVKRLLAGKEPRKMIPWFKDFTGTIEHVGDDGDRFEMCGVFKRHHKSNKTTIEVTEIPLETSIESYKVFLETEMSKKESILISFTNMSTETKPHFVLKVDPKHFMNVDDRTILKKLKLIRSISMNNMYLLNENGNIEKFDTPLDILKRWVVERQRMYVRRKAHVEDSLMKVLANMEININFIYDVIEERIVVLKRSRKNIVEQIKAKGSYPPRGMDNSADLSTSNDGYDYLFKISISSLTLEKAEHLKRQCDIARAQLKQVQSTSAEQLWLNDIAILEKTNTIFTSENIDEK